MEHTQLLRQDKDYYIRSYNKVWTGTYQKYEERSHATNDEIN